jgi:hypothetical protein
MVAKIKKMGAARLRLTTNDFDGSRVQRRPTPCASTAGIPAARAQTI